MEEPVSELLFPYRVRFCSRDPWQGRRGLSIEIHMRHRAYAVEFGFGRWCRFVKGLA